MPTHLGARQSSTTGALDTECPGTGQRISACPADIHLPRDDLGQPTSVESSDSNPFLDPSSYFFPNRHFFRSTKIRLFPISVSCGERSLCCNMPLCATSDVTAIFSRKCHGEMEKTSFKKNHIGCWRKIFGSLRIREPRASHRFVGPTFIGFFPLWRRVLSKWKL